MEKETKIGPATNENRDPETGVNCNGIDGTPLIGFRSEWPEGPELTVVE